MLRPLIAIALASVGLLLPARAQETPATQHVLRQEARAHLQPADTTLASRTVAVPSRDLALPAASARRDTEEGVLRAVYGIEPAAAPAGSPAETARAYLSMHAAAFGWGEDLQELTLEEVRQRANSQHATFQQVVNGVPVYGRRVRVSLDRQGQPTMVISGFAPHIRRSDAVNLTPALSAADAEANAHQLVARGAVRTGPPVLMVYPAHPARLVWRLVAWPEAAPAEWEVLVDAHTGDIVRVTDQTVRGKREAGKRRTGALEMSSFPISPIPRLPDSQVDGSGYVFDPDPLSTAGVAYGGSYSDDGDADAPALNGERRLVALQGLTQDEDGRYRLEGPYVRIVGERAYGDTVYDPPAVSSPDSFRFTRAADDFEAVNVYYHIDQSRRYVQELGFSDLQDAPVRANPRAGEGDYSQYYPSQNLIEFGTGGVDDGEDASVIWHEHAHALLEASAPGLRASREGQALHEGWADYWAGSYLRYLAETERIQRSDWRRLFRWDSGEGAFWAGRTLEAEGTYPEDTRCDDNSDCDIYEDGLLWATTLMAVYADLGRTVTDRLNLASHAYLSHPVTFRDASEALLQADRDLYEGRHLPILLEHLGRSGFINRRAPTILRPPPQVLVQPAQARSVPVTVAARGVGLDEIAVQYDGFERGTAVLEPHPSRPRRFQGRIPLIGRPAVGDSLTYRLYLRDMLGNETVYPHEDAEPLLIRFRNMRTQNALRGVHASGAWQQEGGTWIARSGAGHAGLVLSPLTLPDNADVLRFVLDHQYVLGDGAGGNVKVSADDGRTWVVLSPVAGYDTTFAAPGHPMNGEPVFAGASDGMLTSRFDVSDYAGRSVQLRIELGAADSLDGGEHWRIEQAHYRIATREDRLEAPRQLTLHTNFPDPFAGRTTFSYTLPEAMAVHIALYDMLGRRVDIVADGEHSAGTHTVNYDGRRLASGVYFLRLTAGGVQKVERMVVAR